MKDITQNIIKSLTLEEKQELISASKVCDSLNNDFIASLNYLLISHTSIDTDTFLTILRFLMSKKDKKQDNESLIIYLSKLIGLDIKLDVENTKASLSIKFNEYNNKILLEISQEVTEQEYLNVFSTALADILCHYTNGKNKKLYSAYSIDKNINEYEELPTHKNMDKIRLSILDVLNLLNTYTSNETSEIDIQSNTSKPMLSSINVA